jgi:hypothetical protein
MESYEEPITPEPSEEDIRESMRLIATQFGEKFEEPASKESSDQLITRLGQEGWHLVDVITSAHKVTAEYDTNEDIKIVGTGTKFRIFKRAKNEKPR